MVRYPNDGCSGDDDGPTVSDSSLVIPTHVTVNLSEVAHPGALFSHLSKPGKQTAYAGVYDDDDLLGDNTILALAVHLREVEQSKTEGRKSLPRKQLQLGRRGGQRRNHVWARKSRSGHFPQLPDDFHRSALRPTCPAGSPLRSSRPFSTRSLRPRLWLSHPTKSSNSASPTSKLLTIPTLFWLAALGGA